jgi:type I restriction enzyme S subunit
MCITIAANIAETGILAFDACFPDSVVGFIPFEENIDVKYFEYFIRTAKSHLEDYAPSTAQKNINLDILGQLLVPLPPAKELRRIVAKVDEFMALSDALKARLADAQTTQIRLADTIVEKAVAQQS